MTKSAIITGVILVVFGIWLFFKILRGTENILWLYIYPAVIIIIGIGLMVFWKSEDRIEERKD